MSKIHGICGVTKKDTSRLLHAKITKDDIEARRNEMLCPYPSGSESRTISKKEQQFSSILRSRFGGHETVIERKIYGTCLKTKCGLYDAVTGTCKGR